MLISSLALRLEFTLNKKACFIGVSGYFLKKIGTVKRIHYGFLLKKAVFTTFMKKSHKVDFQGGLFEKPLTLSSVY